VKAGVPSWVQKSCIRFLHRDASWEDFQEELFSGRISRINEKYMGDDCVLLTHVNEDSPEKMVEENKAGLENLFHEIVEWSDSIILRHKHVWLRCRGLPLTLWNKEIFTNMVATQAREIVDIDEATLSLENVEFTIFKAKISITSEANFFKRIKINGTLHSVVLRKELSVSCSCIGRRCNQSSESVTFIDSFVEGTCFGELEATFDAQWASKGQERTPNANHVSGPKDELEHRGGTVSESTNNLGRLTTPW